jgi:hypothetical protein
LAGAVDAVVVGLLETDEPTAIMKIDQPMSNAEAMAIATGLRQGG